MADENCCPSPTSRILALEKTIPEKALRTSSLQLNQSALRTAVAHSMNSLWNVVEISGDSDSVGRWRKQKTRGVKDTTIKVREDVLKINSNKRTEVKTVRSVQNNSD